MKTLRHSDVTGLWTAATWAVALMVPQLTQAAGLAESFKDLNDEVRASIVKELVKSRMFDTQDPNKKSSGKKGDSSTDFDDDAGGKNSPNDCNLEIGNAKAEPGRPAPRRVTVVVTGPIIQMCKK